MTRLLLSLSLLLAVAACSATGMPPADPAEPQARTANPDPAPQVAAPKQSASVKSQTKPPAGVATSDAIVAGGHRYTPLGVNPQGYREFRRDTDGATVVLIPEGYFHKRAYWDTPGTAERAEGHWQFMPAFLMDKFEVTNVQVAAYLRQAQDLRFEQGRVIGPGGLPWAADHPWGLSITTAGVNVRPGFERHPAVGVSGWLSLAYARWVGGDLPTGLEYEKAAAGPSGLLFPWGDETMLPDSTRANSYLHGPRRTTAVGSYPAGVSPYGLHDMAGNTYSRAYWEEEPTADPKLTGNLPTMLKGGSWVSPNWWNLRCVCRCGQSMDAMDGSVGLRVVVRAPDVLRQFTGDEPQLHVFTNTAEAYLEAEARNVPIFLYMGYERCGQCDRLQAQLFKDPEFVRYCNENLVVLIGHHTRDFNDLPKTPLAPGGIFFAHSHAFLADMVQVFEDFSVRRDPMLGPLPDHVSMFIISPALVLLNPHRRQITDPEDAVLASETDLWSLKTGSTDPRHWKPLFERAQQRLGPYLTRTQHDAGDPLPQSTWQPTPEDDAMWHRAMAGMETIYRVLKAYHAEHGEYPKTLVAARMYFERGRIPQDPFRGTYFRYERTDSGYRLVCHGADDMPGGDNVPDLDIVITEAGRQ